MRTATHSNGNQEARSGDRAGNPGKPADNSRITLLAMIFLQVAGLNSAIGEDFDQHMAELRRKVPSQAFTLVRQTPFVVIGDEPAEIVRSRASSIVKLAVDSLKRDYFAKDPAEIIDIWLFKDKESYEKHTRK